MSNGDLAKKRVTILEEKRNVTSRISETCRFVGFGLLAIFYTLKIGDGSFPENIRENYPYLLFVVGLSGAAAIGFDYLQYLFGARAVDEALRRDSLDYDSESFSYRARAWSYYVKQVAVGIGAVAIIILVFLA